MLEMSPKLTAVALLNSEKNRLKVLFFHIIETTYKTPAHLHQHTSLLLFQKSAQVIAY
jgi:hypothetical protein